MAGDGYSNMRLSTQAGRGNEVLMVARDRVKLFFYVAICRETFALSSFSSVALTLKGDAHEIAETWT
jgi:hypothetical protein